MFFNALLVIAALTSFVGAQLTTADPPVPSHSPCLIRCITLAAEQNNCGYDDALCLCTNSQFQADAGLCVQQNCSATDVAAAQALIKECTDAGLTPTAAGTPTPTPVTFTSASVTESPSVTGSPSPSVTPSVTQSASRR